MWYMIKIYSHKKVINQTRMFDNNDKTFRPDTTL